MKPLHPYAIIIGIGAGIATLATLRHPLFAILIGGVAMLGVDMAIKSRLSSKDNNKDDKDL